MIKYLIFIIILITGCSTESKSNLPVKSKLPEVVLKDFNENEFIFSDLKGKVIVLSYIYTSCPDICHITSSKLNTFKKSLNDKDNIFFISISVMYFIPKFHVPLL